jgi:hypothetical protein
VARPTLDEVLKHQFIRGGPIPLRVPLSALYTTPIFTEDQYEPAVVEEVRRPLVAITPGQSLEDYYDDGEPIDDKQAAIAAAAAALNGVPKAERRVIENTARADNVSEHTFLMTRPLTKKCYLTRQQAMLRMLINKMHRV